jgi:hypothetical protein
VAQSRRDMNEETGKRSDNYLREIVKASKWEDHLKVYLVRGYIKTTNGVTVLEILERTDIWEKGKDILYVRIPDWIAGKTFNERKRTGFLIDKIVECLDEGVEPIIENMLRHERERKLTKEATEFLTSLGYPRQPGDWMSRHILGNGMQIVIDAKGDEVGYTISATVSQEEISRAIKFLKPLHIKYNLLDYKTTDKIVCGECGVVISDRDFEVGVDEVVRCQKCSAEL